MHKRVSSGERHTSSGDNNAKKIIAPIRPIIDRSMANGPSTACRPASKKLRSVPIGYYLDWWVSVTGYGCVGVSKLLGSITTPALILP